MGSKTQSFEQRKSLNYYLSPGVIRSTKRLYKSQGSLYSLQANILLKAAWRLGFEYTHDHPLVLNELLPIEPNPNYENPYFFVDGYKGDIPQSWLDFFNENPVPKHSLP